MSRSPYAELPRTPNRHAPLRKLKTFAATRLGFAPTVFAIMRDEDRAQLQRVRNQRKRRRREVSQ